MERKHHSPEEIKAVLQDLDSGMTIDAVVVRHRVSKASVYRWRKKAQATESAHVKRLQSVDEENRRLRNLLADAVLEIHALKEKLKKEI